MKIISITYRRTDLIKIQHFYWNKYLPNVPFYIAAHEDNLLNIEPDIILNYKLNQTRWPNCYLNAVIEILDNIDDDLIIVESDIFPIKAFNIEDYIGSIRLWADNPYPGLLFMPKERKDFNELKGLQWRHADIRDFSYEIPKAVEIIDETFLHLNHGDTAFKRRKDPRLEFLKNFSFTDTWERPKEKILEKNKKVEKHKKDDVKVREPICKECDHLKNNICLQIKKKRGCSACSKPWSIYHNRCPLGKWAI